MIGAWALIAAARAWGAEGVEAPALGGRYLVVVASKRSLGELDPSMEAAARLGVRPVAVASARFDGLAPCWWVAVADSAVDKASAVASAARLRAGGVEAYVKQAGRYVGPSAQIDAYCAAEAPPRPVDGLAFAVVAGGRAFVPASATARAVDPIALDDGVWWQPGDGPAPAAVWYLADARSGKTAVCRTRALAVLTVGTPHAGLIAGATGPTCGSPAGYVELDCALSPGVWVASQRGPLAPWSRTAAPVPAGAAAEGAGRARWSELEDHRWSAFADAAGPAARVVAVGEAEDGQGVCGGDAVQSASVWVDGKRQGVWLDLSFGGVEGLVDVDGDGQPEWIWSVFPNTFGITRLDGTLVHTERYGYCDCPC